MMAARTLLFLVALCAAPVAAQETGGNGGSGGETGSPDGGESAGVPGRSSATQVTAPQQIVTRLSDISGFCAASGAYVVDCMAERIEALEQDMAGLSSYQDVRQILRDTAADLRTVSRGNRDPLLPRIRVTDPGSRLKSSRPLVAVAPARRQKANKAAIAVLQQAETVLLRSAGQSAARAGQYQKIAAALGSNKVLLRST